MPGQSDVLTLPRAGRLQMDIHLSAEVNVTAAMARRKVNAFLVTHAGQSSGGSQSSAFPRLDSSSPALLLIEEVKRRLAAA